MSIEDKDVPSNEPPDIVNREPAEGSRENAGGISNRPLSEEVERQENLPPRGESKEGSHA